MTKLTMTSTLTRLTAGAAMGGAFLLFGGAAAANAQPGDGRVDLAIGTAGVLTGVPIETASQIAAGVCDDAELATITTAAESVDADGTQQNVCTSTEIGAIDFRQNIDGAADGTPGVTTPGTAEGASYAEEPTTEQPAPEVTGDEEAAVEDGETPVTTTTVPAPSPVG